MINFKKFNSVISLTSYFTSDDKCKQAIIESRWGVGKEQDIVCPYCGKHHCKMSKNGRFHCTGCNKNFSCLVGTIFENTKLPLIKWFLAMHFISSHKKGISSYQPEFGISDSRFSCYVGFPTDAYYIYPPNNMDGKMQNCKVQIKFTL